MKSFAISGFNRVYVSQAYNVMSNGFLYQIARMSRKGIAEMAFVLFLDKNSLRKLNSVDFVIYGHVADKIHSITSSSHEVVIEITKY